MCSAQFRGGLRKFVCPETAEAPTCRPPQKCRRNIETEDATNGEIL